MDSQDIFHFYNSSIGDLTKLMHKYAIPDLAPTPGFITNAFGVRINPKHLPEVLKGRSGVEPIPIPANWHADIAEFGGVFRAVDVAREYFTVVELGCGWACWLNIAGAAARKRGLKLHLIGVEGDAGHVKFAQESLIENGFSSVEFKIHHAIAGSSNGCALFPNQNAPGVSWGLEAVFNPSDEEKEKLLSSGQYNELKLVSLPDILPPEAKQIDLLHIDIQGAEVPLIPDLIDFLNSRVAMMLIGTHSRVIEGKLFECLYSAGWALEVERPAILKIGKTPQTLVDGVQLWRNPNLLPNEMFLRADTQGKVQILTQIQETTTDTVLEIEVLVVNDSCTDWDSRNIDFPVSLSYHWTAENGENIVFDGLRTGFNGGSLASNASTEQIMRVAVPDTAGMHTLTVTVVQDGIRWFDNTEFKPSATQVKVVEAQNHPE